MFVSIYIVIHGHEHSIMQETCMIWGKNKTANLEWTFILDCLVTKTINVVKLVYDVLASGQQNSLGINDYSFSLESTLMHYYLSKVELFKNYELGTEFFMFVACNLPVLNIMLLVNKCLLSLHFTRRWCFS